ncbi:MULTISPECIES: adenylyl-sulfate kinase [Ralstonia solanacearum species complex]|nr:MULTISPECIES: adenylyl-sulfate kinase [Ralstonia solanacearum species complex]CBJ35674.1 Adenosine 5'-phosphosulfate kinase [Ralstonia solanacearum PSI07]
MKSSPSTLWLTGLSAAGKTTLAYALAQALTAAGAACRILDGDAVRQESSRDLGFSRADRSQNIRRVADRCRQLNDAGSWAIAAVISPYREDRERARRTVGESRFFEVYLATPLTVCERRDPKGLYRRARAGEIANFTGISDAYEVPQHPDLRFDTATQPVAECVAATMARLAAVSGQSRLKAMR